MKDIFKFIFTFSGSEKVIEKTNEEKRKIFKIIFFILIIFIAVYFNIIFGLFLWPFTLLSLLTFISFYIFFGEIKYLFFKIFKLKIYFLDAVYLSSIIFIIKFLSFILLFIGETLNFPIINILSIFWAFTIDFILMKKLTNNLFGSIICSILFISVLFYYDILILYDFYLNKNL